MTQNEFKETDLKALERFMHIGEETTQTIKDSGSRRVFESGAVRDIQEGKGRCDLMPLDVVADIMKSAIMRDLASFQEDGNIEHLQRAIVDFAYCKGIRLEELFLEVSVHFEEGAKKYGENNWQKGIPISSYLNSAVRHYLKDKRGDDDERHDRAFVWNLLCCIWTIKKEANCGN